MDYAKCRTLKAELAAQSASPIVPSARFFDGNDDLGSIGCNLNQHPGVDKFREVLTGLLLRTDVQAVYAWISELDPGEDCWPFTDTILVVGKVSAEALRKAVSVLEPDEVAAAEGFGVSPFIAEGHGSSVTAIWWD